jgi:hypothetical protein
MVSVYIYISVLSQSFGPVYLSRNGLTPFVIAFANFAIYEQEWRHDEMVQYLPSYHMMWLKMYAISSGCKQMARQVLWKSIDLRPAFAVFKRWDI